MKSVLKIVLKIVKFVCKVFVKAGVVMLSAHIIAVTFGGGHLKGSLFEAFIGLAILLAPADAIVNFIDRKFLQK